MIPTLTTGISSDDFLTLDLVFKSTYPSIDLVHHIHLDLDTTTPHASNRLLAQFAIFFLRDWLIVRNAALVDPLFTELLPWVLLAVIH
jgi:hypothetical protein